MDIANAALKRINSTLSEQIHQPPPINVLGAVTALVGAPSSLALAASVSWKQTETSWQVLALADGLVVDVSATAPVSDWYGGHSSDHDAGESIVARCWPLQRLRSVELLDPTSRTLEGGDRDVQGTWVLHLDTDRVEVGLDRRYRHLTDEWIDKVRVAWAF